MCRDSDEELSGSDAADDLELDAVEEISDDDDLGPLRPPPRKRAALPARACPRRMRPPSAA